MSESTFKNELLKQEAGHCVETDVAQLKKMIDAEDRRARRLMRWALGAWLLFFLMLVVGLGLPMVSAHANPPVQTRPTGQPAPNTTTPPAQLAPHHTDGVLAAIVAPIMIVGFFSLPIIAVTLTIMALLARRTAGKRQILAALAAIEAQLRALAATQSRSSEG